MTTSDTTPHELDEPVTSYATAEDRSLLHAGALLFFDGPLERLDVVRAVARAAVTHHALRARPPRVPLAADVLAWSPDPAFRASKQVHLVEIDDVRDERVLARAVARVWSRGLPGDRPPWEVTLLADRHAGPSVVLVKGHRALTDADGVALAAMVLGTPHGAAPAGSREPARRSGLVPGLLHVVSLLADEGTRRSRALATEVRAMLRPGVALARTREVGRILESAGTLLSSPAPETPWNGVLGAERAVAWMALSRDVLRGIQDVFGGSWQDAWLTIVAEALGRHLRSRGRTTTGLTLLAYVPGDEHGHGAAVLSSAASHATARLVGLPVDEMSPASRHAAIVKSHLDPLSAARGSGLEQLARLSQHLPEPLQSMLGSLCYQAANTVLAVGPAPPPLLLGERTATSIVPLAALPWHVGLALAALEDRSGEIAVGLTADLELVPRLDDVVRALHDAYVDVAAAAGVPPVDPLRLRRARR